MKKLALPENFDHKNIDILKQFITETGKIIYFSITDKVIMI